ncbi:unnamed protein product [Caenorhabditis sp. 36 PRJEB53466]|nr:unnamed protein product [Caenorhabditis sp. 36 PRJEB53466]
MRSTHWSESVRWSVANIGWPSAFTFWYQIIVVLYSAHGLVSPIAIVYFHFLWLIIVCSFFSASFTPPKQSRESVEWDQSERTEKMCDTCEYVKPARWHHCRRCNQCVHRMDHHCPILQMCIHRDNHKFFLLFLLWPLQLATFTVYHGYHDFWKMMRSIYTKEVLSAGEQLKGTGVSNAVMVGLAATWLLKNQIPNLLRNQTLIEEANENTDYDLGTWQKNVQFVMGPWRIAWLPTALTIETERKEE